MSTRPVLSFAVALLAAVPWLRAQDVDPTREIQEIARAVEKQLQEIDQLLLESGKKDQARQQPKDLLQRAHERAEAVEGGIDKLIEKLNQMKNQGSGSGQPDDQQQQQQQQQQDQDQQQSGRQQQQSQGRRNRRENQTPDLVPRPQQQPGEQPQPQGQQPGQQPQPGEGQQPQPQDGKPQNGQENPSGGENTRGNRQLEPDTAPGNPGTGDGTWGELQPYMNFLKNRGSRPPSVPEKFRKYWEAHLKQKQQGGGKPGGK
jgi:hypothetical protein